MSAGEKSLDVLERENKEREEAKREAFLQCDYELKISYLTSHFDRMWNRFNYFVAIETALIGGNVLIPKNGLSRELAIAGAIFSVIWYIMGAEDRFLVRLYRHQIKEAAKSSARTIWSDDVAQKSYQHVGKVDKDAIADIRQAESKNRDGTRKSYWQQFVELEWLSGWRWEVISTTKLAALFPLLVFILWLIILFGR